MTHDVAGQGGESGWGRKEEYTMGLQGTMHTHTNTHTNLDMVIYGITISNFKTI